MTNPKMQKGRESKRGVEDQEKVPSQEIGLTEMAELHIGQH